MVKVQVMSDLHLEIPNNIEHSSKLPKQLKIKGEFLCLCGDIGNPFSKQYKDFMVEICKKFKQVFIIAGNHEFYNNEFFATKKRIGDICRLGFRNAHYLDGSSWVYKKEKIRFIGATMWTNIPEDKRKIIAHSLNDYRMCKFKEDGEEEKNITTDFIVKQHKIEHKKVMKELELAKKNGEHVVIMTHHAPVWKGCLKKEDDFIGDGYCNHFEDMLGYPIMAWFHGHTHNSNHFRVNDTVIYSNQYGYKFNDEKTGFEYDKWVSICPALPIKNWWEKGKEKKEASGEEESSEEEEEEKKEESSEEEEEKKESSEEEEEDDEEEKKESSDEESEEEKKEESSEEEEDSD